MERSDPDFDKETLDRPEYRTFHANWQGINLEIRHCPRWLCSSGDYVTQHIEIRSTGKVRLPITETGYRSHFMNGPQALAEFDDDPIVFVLWMLDEAGKSKEWLARVEADRQYSLF